MVKQVDTSLHSKLKELAEKLQVNRAVQLMESALVQVPTVVGWLKPVILLPASALTGLTSEQLEAMLAHELAHIKRFDYLVNMLQTVVEILGFYHPAVWWVSHKIRAERENCCDDLAVSISGDRVRYARALTLMEEIRASRGELAVAASGGSLFARISRLVGKESSDYSRDGWIPSAVAILLIMAMIIPTTIALTSGATKEPIAEQKEKPTKSLHQAAAEGDIEQVKSLISKGADVNAKDKRGKTPLHYASEKGHTDVSSLLISQGARINVTDAMAASTPLHYAARRGDKQTAELLLNKGADINAKNSFGMTPLFVAIRSTTPGGKEVVELLAARGANAPALQLAAYMGDMEKLKKCLQDGMDINSQEGFGCTALHAAADSGRKDIVEFLISKGAEVDPQDTEHLTPLYYAVTHNHEDIADVLLAKGADVNAGQKDRGWNLLNYAIWDESKDAVKLLISKGADLNVKDDVHGWTPLFYAIYMGNRDIVEIVVSKGADVRAKDYVGRTPLDYAMEDHEDLVDLLTAKGATAAPVSALHVAAREGDLEKVKRLIEEGADINAKDTALETPLSLAIISEKNNDLVKFLIAKGADVNAKTRLGGYLILHVACGSSPLDVIELLIAKGADVNAKAPVGGFTPLHIACVQGRKDVAELLIAKGADLNARTTPFELAPGEFGWTALHASSVFGRKDVAELLIAKGADINARNSNSRTPLHAACFTGRKDVAELLIAKGADVNARDNKEQTPLSLAKEQGHEEIVELLRKHGAKE